MEIKELWTGQFRIYATRRGIEVVESNGPVSKLKDDSSLVIITKFDWSELGIRKVEFLDGGEEK